MMVTRLGPRAATKASASRICGNDWLTSTTVPMAVSTMPPTNPLTSPAVTPMMRLTNTADTPTISEIRAPWTIRLSTSRPTWSVPSGYAALPPVCHTGGVKRRSTLLGRIVRRHPRRGERDAHHDEQDQHAREGGRVEREPPPRPRAAGGGGGRFVGDGVPGQGDGHQRSLIVGFR